MVKYINYLHNSMKSMDSILSQATRLKFLEQISSLPKSLVRTLTLESRLVQMIAVNASERAIFLDQLQTDESQTNFWSTHLQVFELFYQIFDNDDIDFELIDRTIRGITNITNIILA